jgi:hypothetical protein
MALISFKSVRFFKAPAPPPGTRSALSGPEAKATVWQRLKRGPVPLILLSGNPS